MVPSSRRDFHQKVILQQIIDDKLLSVEDRTVSIKDDTNGSQDLFGQILFQLEFDDLDCCSDVPFLSSRVNTSNTVQTILSMFHYDNTIILR